MYGLTVPILYLDWYRTGRYLVPYLGRYCIFNLVKFVWTYFVGVGRAQYGDTRLDEYVRKVGEEETRLTFVVDDSSGSLVIK